MMRTAVHALLALSLLSAPTLVRAAQYPPQPSAGLFDRVIPQPTGRNGYEELVMAGDVLNHSAAWQAFYAGGEQTLAAKRALVADRDVRKALDLLRAGLEKPVFDPRQQVDEDTQFPELSAFRGLARLLVVEIYVRFADGRSDEAVGMLRDGLRFGYALQTDTLISGLVSTAVDSLIVRGFADHLDQLSADDCDRVLAIVRDWMAQPDPAVVAVTQERNQILQSLRNYRAQPVKLVAALKSSEDAEDPESDHADLIAALSDSRIAGPVIDEASAEAAAYYDHAIPELRRPAWQRANLSLPGPGASAADQLAGIYTSVIARVSDIYTADNAKVQLIGVHAAIRRYRWEHARMPDSLATLGLGGMAVDPFTGRPLQYRRLGNGTYQLTSVGPIDRTPDAPVGKRVQIDVSQR